MAVSRLRLAICCLLIGFSVPASATERAGDTDPAWYPWIEFGGYYNSRKSRTVSSGVWRGETSLFLPVYGDQSSLLFSQLIYKETAGGGQEGNVALGYRTMLDNGFNLGGWVGGDARRSDLDNFFGQISGGFEALSDSLDMRANWYGPVTKPRAGAAVVQQTGGIIEMAGGEEIGLKGADLEFGYRLPLEYFGIDRSAMDFRIYAGAFYFDDPDIERAVVGPMGRAEYVIRDGLFGDHNLRLAMEYEIRHPQGRRTRHEMGLRLRIPLGAGKNQSGRIYNPQKDRMMDSLVRDTDIVSVDSKPEPIADALTGVELQTVSEVAGGESLTTASSNAGDNALLIVTGTVTGAQTVQANQTIMSGTGTIAVRGTRSGRIINYTPALTAGTVSVPGAADNIAMQGANTHINAIEVIGDVATNSGSNNGIRVTSGLTNLYLTDMTIRDTGNTGLNVSNNTTISVIDTTFRDTDDISFVADDGNTLTLTRVTMTNAGDDAFQFDNNNTVVIRDSTFTGTTTNAITTENDNTITISGSTFRTTGNNALTLENDNTITVSGSTFDAFEGLVFDDRNTITITGSRLGNNRDEMINLSDNDNSILFSGNTIFGAPADDIFRVEGTGNQVRDGSDNNVDDTTNNPTLCRTTGVGAFTGTISFTNGTTLTDNVAPCN